VASPAPSTRVPEVSFLEFRERAGLDRLRVPLEGTIETTYRCNLNCVHCYVNQPAGSREERERELSLERLKQLIDEMVAEGTLFVLFTGGEVLVRRDFPELYLYARAQGLLVTIFTNGTLVTERIADLFAEHRPEKIEISLYGMTRETYDRVTRVPGSFDKCMEGIQRLVDRGIPLSLKTMALAWNQHEIQAMDAYAKSLGLVFRFDSSLNPRVDCGPTATPSCSSTPSGRSRSTSAARSGCRIFASSASASRGPTAITPPSRSTAAARVRARSPSIPTAGCRCVSCRARASTT